MIWFLCTWRPFETHRLISCIYYPAETLLLLVLCFELHADEPANVCRCVAQPKCTCGSDIASSWTHVLTEPDDVFYHSKFWGGTRLDLIQLPDADLMPRLNQSPCPPLDSSPRDPFLPPRRTQEKQPKCLRPSLCSNPCLDWNKLVMKSMLGPQVVLSEHPFIVSSQWCNTKMQALYRVRLSAIPFTNTCLWM